MTNPANAFSIDAFPGSRIASQLETIISQNDRIIDLLSIQTGTAYTFPFQDGSVHFKDLTNGVEFPNALASLRHFHDEDGTIDSAYTHNYTTLLHIEVTGQRAYYVSKRAYHRMDYGYALFETSLHAPGVYTAYSNPTLENDKAEIQIISYSSAIRAEI
jgi:hypothetical protein